MSELYTGLDSSGRPKYKPETFEEEAYNLQILAKPAGSSAYGAFPGEGYLWVIDAIHLSMPSRAIIAVAGNVLLSIWRGIYVDYYFPVISRPAVVPADTGIAFDSGLMRFPGGLPLQWPRSSYDNKRIELNSNVLINGYISIYIGVHREVV